MEELADAEMEMEMEVAMETESVWGYECSSP